MRILSKLADVYWRYLASTTNYARHIGVNIGKNCLISTRNWDTEPYLITIGDNVQITEGVSFHTHGGAHVVRSQVPDFDVFGKIIVKNGAYIGAHSTILAGVTIGEGTLVAAGSIVTKSVDSHTVVGGNPARVICTVEEYLNKNIKYNTHSKGMSYKKKRELLMSLPEDSFIKK